MTPQEERPRRRTRIPVRGVLSAALLSAFALVPLGPAVHAADTPTDAVLELFAAIEQGRFAAIPSLVCSDRAADMERRLDLTQVVDEVPSSVRSAALRAVEVDVSRLVAHPLEEDADRALVQVTAEVTTGLDRRALRRALTGSIAPEGVIDEAILRSLLAERVADRVASIAAAAVLDEEVDVIREGGAWRVCGDIGWGLEPLDPADVCSLISPAELALLAPLPLTTSTATDSGCTYSADEASPELSTISIWVEDGDLELVRSVYPDGSGFDVHGHDGFAAEDGARVDLGGRLLVIQVDAVTPAQDFDTLAVARAIAEVIVPRADR